MSKFNQKKTCSKYKELQIESPSVRNLCLASSDKALYIWFGLEHSKTSVTANTEVISASKFDSHQIGKPDSQR